MATPEGLRIYRSLVKRGGAASIADHDRADQHLPDRGIFIMKKTLPQAPWRR